MTGDNKANLEMLLKEVGALLSGHFLLSSGKHSNQYVQAQKLFQYPRYGMVIAQAMAEGIMQTGLRPTAIVGPALGAVHLELLVALAYDLACSRINPNQPPIRGIFAERPEGNFEIRRGVELSKQDKVFVVEDVTTTGGSVQKVVDLVRSLGAEVIGVGTVIDRSGGSVTFDVPFMSLIKLALKTYDANNCDLCKEGSPCIKPGSTKMPSA